MPKDFKGQEPKGWFTVKGVHIPILDGETKEDALARAKKQFEEKNKSKKKFESFGDSYSAESSAVSFLEKKSNSNYLNWEDDLSGIERNEIYDYTDEPGTYDKINPALYKSGYKKIADEEMKQQIDFIEGALDKFELYKGIRVTRQSSLRMLGFSKKDEYNRNLTEEDIRKKLSGTFGYMQYKAFLSSSADEDGRDIAGSGVIVHIKVPPSKGAGAYVARQSSNKPENEYLFNRNAVLKYDLTTLKKTYGSWEIEAEWVGQAPD